MILKIRGLQIEPSRRGNVRQCTGGAVFGVTLRIELQSGCDARSVLNLKRISGV